MSRYYDDLSADSNLECSSTESEDDEKSRADHVQPRSQNMSSSAPTPSPSRGEPASQGLRFILHMDVDCFYCQCECIFRKIPFDRPLAIGQKHIVVTCNYAAREVGVTKLQLREDAVRACPHLLIVEGSDLERYRIYARQIYLALRRVCKELHPDVQVAKGSMDEASVDLTSAVLDVERKNGGASTLHPSNTESSISSIFVCNERRYESMKGLQRAFGLDGESNPERKRIVKGLDIAAKLALYIRSSILQETGFTATFGVSLNPLLSKISSGLRKPGTVNVLHPWNGAHVLRSKELRGIPGIGSSMVRALRPCLEESLPGRPPDHKWTCGELSGVPVHIVESCLRSVPSFSKSASELARTILAKCSGVDDSPVLDDAGRPPQVVSVENSFRRGTLLSHSSIEKGMEDLFRRLPRLLQDRWANFPSDYPKTIRLTIRYVSSHPGDGNRVAWRGGRSNSITTSEQSPINGRQLLEASTLQIMSNLIQSSVEPLLRSLLRRIELNVTRINVCLADFRLTTADSTANRGNPFSQLKATQREYPEIWKSFNPPSDLGSPCADGKASSSPGNHEITSGSSVRTKRPAASPLSIDNFDPAIEAIDPKVLEELPPDIAQEIRNAIEEASQSRKRQRTKTLDQFFARRSGSKKAC